MVSSWRCHRRGTGFALLDMALSTDDRLTIYELLTLRGHLLDERSFDRLAKLFTDDFA